MFVPEVEFCGHVLGHGCRRPSPGKLSALAKWPRPTTVTELRAFLGFCNWYSDYVKNYATHAGPLHAMLQLKRPDAKAGCKLKLRWTDEANICFNTLKEELCGKLSLHLVDPDLDFTIHTDSSGYAVGAVLEQEFNGKLCPVAFWSRKLTPGQRKWSPREQETYAIVCALRKYAGYIGLRHVTVITDHECLRSWHKEHVDTPSGPAGRRGRWHELFSKFDLEVKWAPGKDNLAADAMSRWAYPARLALNDVSKHGSLEDALEVTNLLAEEEADRWALDVGMVNAAKKKSNVAPKSHANLLPDPSGPEFVLWHAQSIFLDDWPQAYQNCPHWQDMWAKCHGNGDDWPTNCQLRGDKKQFMYIGGKLCVPTGLAKRLVHQWHEGPLGHAGQRKMLLDMKTRFVMVDMAGIVKEVRQTCQTCQACDAPNFPGAGNWQPTPIPDRPMMSISIDIVTMSPTTTWDGRNVDSCLVVVDRHTGWVCAWPMAKAGFTAKMAAQMVHCYWFDVFGIPTTITSDLGPHFIGTWWRTLCALKGIHHATAISYRSQTNGRAEKAISQVLDRLRKLHQDHRLDWSENLPRALQLLHDIPGPAGVSPYFALFGRDRLAENLPLPCEHMAEDALIFAERMAKLDTEIRNTLDRLHEQARKEWLNAPAFVAGDLVWTLRPRPLGIDKVSTMWVGPCKVLQRLSAHTYHVQLGDTTVRDVHTSQLKKHFASCVGPSWPLFYTRERAEDTHALEGDWDVEKIVRHRKKKDGTLEFLTKWEHCDDSENTWEPPASFLQRFCLPWAEYCRAHRIDLSLLEHLRSLA